MILSKLTRYKRLSRDHPFVRFELGLEKTGWLLLHSPGPHTSLHYEEDCPLVTCLPASLLTRNPQIIRTRTVKVSKDSEAASGLPVRASYQYTATMSAYAQGIISRPPALPSVYHARVDRVALENCKRPYTVNSHNSSTATFTFDYTESPNVAGMNQQSTRCPVIIPGSPFKIVCLISSG